MNKISQWLDGLNLGKYAETFSENAIVFDVLAELTDADLKGFEIPFGDRKRLLKAIAALANHAGSSPAASQRDQSAADIGIAEYRQLTVMFCDLVDSTVLSEQMDLENYWGMLAAYRATVAKAIQNYDGYIANHMGDGVLVYFGFPQAHEDDAERAAKSGLAIIESIQELNTSTAVELQVRIGVATGLVVAGDIIGEGVSEERAVLGSTPNLAARLQGLAAPNTVVVSSDTRHLAAATLEYEDLGKHPLKGFKEPVQSWRIVQVASHESRFHAAYGERDSPLIGRDPELDLLLERWERVKKSEGQVVAFSGEPGIGKSRILQGLKESLFKEQHVRLSYQCSPHFMHSALYAITAQLVRASGIDRQDDDVTKLHKLRSSLIEAETPLGETLALLAALMSIPGDDLPTLKMSPQQQRERTQAVLLEQLLALAAQSPVLVLFEDVHWADPTTLEAITLLIDSMQTQRIMLVLTYRPEFKSAWGGYDHLTLLTLNRLTREQCAVIVKALTKNKELPPTVIERMLDTADGVPLFVEEMTKSVLESTSQIGELVDAEAFSIPATLRDSLMARLDRLGPAKEAAQIGSAIGREFSFELHHAVAVMGEQELDTTLRQIVDSNLMFQHGSAPNSSYVFKHILVQEVAYETMLRDKRLKLHGAIAEALEKRFQSEVNTRPEVLAHHYDKAGNTAKAIEYYERGGRQSAARSENLEARAHFEHALRLVETLPTDVNRDEHELRLLTMLAGSLIASTGYTTPKLDTVLTRAMVLASQADDPMPLFSILHGRYLFQSVTGHTANAYRLAEELFLLTDGDAPLIAQMSSHRILGNSLYLLGEFHKAKYHLEIALSYYEPEMHDSMAISLGQDVRVTALSVLALVEWQLGDAAKALDSARAAVDYAEQIKHVNSLSYALAHTTLLHALCRDFESVRETAESLYAYASEHGLPVWKAASVFFKGWAMAELGQLSEGIAMIKRAAQIGGSIGINYWRPMTLTKLAFYAACAGDFDTALTKLEEAEEVVGNGGEQWSDAERFHIEAQVRLMAGLENDECLQQRFEKALDRARNLNSKPWELQIATALASWYSDHDRVAEAHSLLATIFEAFTNTGHDVKEAEALLESLDA